MDKRYLENIIGSSYIDEGMGNRISARMKSGQQRLSAMSGGNISNLNYTKIESILNGFISKVTKLLQDFSDDKGSVYNKLLQSRPPLNSKQFRILNNFKNLYKSINPSYVSQHQLGNSILNPPNVSRTNLTEIINEGVLNRDMSLNMALQTNDPTKILSTYVKNLRNIYNHFINDTEKVTNLKKSEIKNITGKIKPQWSSIINNISKIVFLPTPSLDNTIPSSEINPISTLKTPSIESPVDNSEFPINISGNSTDITKESIADDFTKILSESLKVIITAVKSDVEHSKEYFNKQLQDKGFYLPKNFTEPSPTEPEWNTTGSMDITIPNGKQGKYVPVSGSESPTDYTYHLKNPPNTSIPHSISEESDENSEESPENQEGAEESDVEPTTGEFVYDFASLYNKYPGKKHAIEVTNQSGVKILLSNNREKILKVFWEWNKHENKIIVKIRDSSSSKWEQGDILKFYDDQVNPRSPSYNLDIGLFLKQASPEMEKSFSISTNKNEIEELINDLRPSFYAIIRRKGVMEFKSKVLRLQLINGKVYKINRTGNPVEIDRNTIDNGFIVDKDPVVRKKWVDALEKIGYFKYYNMEVPDLNVLPSKDISEIPSAMEAVNLLKKKWGVKSMKSVKNAIQAFGSNAETASKEEYIKYAEDELNTLSKKDEPEENPEAITAIKTLVALGDSEKDATKWVKQVIDIDPGLSTQQIIAKVKAQPKSLDEHFINPFQFENFI